ncbi:uncharacterized protein PG986_011129 [Apiospora aurea]|uniref:Uncharacterized protein n=1 Tax=Apiospora aurea TaxID=335848 RepID=A0ABR1Q5I9_9PEZI
MPTFLDPLPEWIHRYLASFRPNNHPPLASDLKLGMCKVDSCHIDIVEGLVLGGPPYASIMAWKGSPTPRPNPRALRRSSPRWRPWEEFHEEQAAIEFVFSAVRHLVADVDCRGPTSSP